MLAHRLNWIYGDGDWFHPRSNVKKMHAGEPLTDEDRWPWLHGIAAWIDASRRVGNHGTVACSALKRAYRDILVGERRDVRIVYLKGGRDLIARRLAARDGHFMPPSLLDSQFAALEEPQPDEHPIVVSIIPHPREIVEEIVKRLGDDASPSPPEKRRRAASMVLEAVRGGRFRAFEASVYYGRTEKLVRALEVKQFQRCALLLAFADQPGKQ